jgi:hypothetical protein
MDAIGQIDTTKEQPGTIGSGHSPRPYPFFTGNPIFRTCFMITKHLHLFKVVNFKDENEQ